MIFVTSWDDGHPLDLKIAELLDRYHLSGTFYIPIRNSEGRAVMSKKDIRTLDSNFDIGSHTHDHIFLDTLSSTECYEQISAGKSQLEDYLGHSVDGFCYPGGKYNANIIKIVQELNIRHARTIKNFYLDIDDDKFQIPTTLQLFPHNKAVYCSNYIKQLNLLNRYQAFKQITFSNDWLSSLLLLVQNYINTDKIFHLWGHSWEIEEQNLWGELETLFKFVSSFQIQTLSVDELIGDQR